MMAHPLSAPFLPPSVHNPPYSDHPPLKKAKLKHVTWAPDDSLCQIRLFSSEDAPIMASTNTHNASTFQPSSFPPGFSTIGVKRARSDSVAVAAMSTDLPWKKPPKVNLDPSWMVVAGEESEQVSVQQQREKRSFEAIYPRFSSIPESPAEPLEPQEAYDERLVPVIPLLSVEEDAPEGEEVPAATTAADGGAGHASDAVANSSPVSVVESSQGSGLNSNVLSTSAVVLSDKLRQSVPSVPENTFSSNQPSPQIAAAAAAAVASLSDPGKVDPDLLAKTIAALTASQQGVQSSSLGTLASSEMTTSSTHQFHKLNPGAVELKRGHGLQHENMVVPGKIEQSRALHGNDGGVGSSNVNGGFGSFTNGIASSVSQSAHPMQGMGNIRAGSHSGLHDAGGMFAGANHGHHTAPFGPRGTGQMIRPFSPSMGHPSHPGDSTAARPPMGQSGPTPPSNTLGPPETQTPPFLSPPNLHGSDPIHLNQVQENPAGLAGPAFNQHAAPPFGLRPQHPRAPGNEMMRPPGPQIPPGHAPFPGQRGPGPWLPERMDGPPEMTPNGLSNPPIRGKPLSMQWVTKVETVPTNAHASSQHPLGPPPFEKPPPRPPLGPNSHGGMGPMGAGGPVFDAPNGGPGGPFFERGPGRGGMPMFEGGRGRGPGFEGGRGRPFEYGGRGRNQEFEGGGGRGRKLCMYFNSPNGCRNGPGCTFLHEHGEERRFQ